MGTPADGKKNDLGELPLHSPCAGTLSTGDMARRTGSTVRTVRFYEEAGLLTPETRRCGGHRVFSEESLGRLELILDLREAGLSLQEIKDLFTLRMRCKSGAEASETMAAALGEQIDTLQGKIAKLRALRDEFATAASIIGECHTCDDRRFNTGCSGCDTLDRPDLPRAVRLLWGR